MRSWTAPYLTVFKDIVFSRMAIIKDLHICRSMAVISQPAGGQFLKALIQFSSIQFKMVSMRPEKPTCAPFRLSEVSPTLSLKWFQCS